MDYNTNNTSNSSSYRNTPWYISTANPKSIIIGKGITKIGKNTFLNVSNATYYYTGTEAEWSIVTSETGNDFTITSYNYNK